MQKFGIFNHLLLMKVPEAEIGRQNRNQSTVSNRFRVPVISSLPWRQCATNNVL